MKLDEYINYLQKKGRYTFLKKEAIDYLGISEPAFRNSVSRAQKKNLLAQPKNGFFAIVPVEHQVASCPPASWFIDPLMDYLGLPYYVSLLSAATMYGAGHQQPQVFQVVTNKQIDDIKAGRIYIKFILKNKWPDYWVTERKTYTGYMKVSTPEGTIIDMIQYMHHSGYIDNIAMVLSELSDELSVDNFKKYLEGDVVPLAYIQRLGYLADFIELKELSEYLYNFIKNKPIKYIPLIPADNEEVLRKDQRWHININHEVELDI